VLVVSIFLMHILIFPLTSHLTPHHSVIRKDPGVAHIFLKRITISVTFSVVNTSLIFVHGDIAKFVISWWSMCLYCFWLCLECWETPPEVYVQTLEYWRRTVTIGKNKTERKKARKHRFNEVRQLPTSSGQKRREILLINQFRLQILGTIPPII